MKNVYLFQHRQIVAIDMKTKETVYDTKLLGFFSSKQKCESQIPIYLQQPGFRDYPDDFFIEKVEADIDDFNNIPGCFDEYVYFLSHEYYDGTYDNVARLGYYSSRDKAKSSKKKYMTTEEFKKYPKGFCIAKCRIDQAYWRYGF